MWHALQRKWGVRMYRWSRAKLCHETNKMFQGALLVASIIVIIKGWGWLDRIQNSTLSALGTRYAAEFQDNTELVDKVVFLRIDQTSYERDFNQQSPLSRKKLSALLMALVGLAEGERPEVVAIDLDLSPGPNLKLCERPQSDEAQRLCNEQSELNDALLELADTTEVVLITPQPVATPAARRAKARWVKSLIGNPNIHFGLPYISSHDGLVIKYDDEPSAFAHVICKAWHEADGGSNYCDMSAKAWKKIGGGSVTPDKLREVLSGKENQLLAAPIESDIEVGAIELLIDRGFSTGIRQHIGSSGLADYFQHPFNYRYLAGLQNRVVTVGSASGGIHLPKQRDFSGKILMVGGDYGVGDRYLLPGMVLAGSQVHLAAFLSIRESLTVPPKFVDYLAEIGFGILIGLALTYLLENYHHNRNVLWLAGNVVGLIAMPIGLAWISLYLLFFAGLWLDPGPLFLGMMIHLLYERFEVEDETMHDKGIFGYWRALGDDFREAWRSAKNGGIAALADLTTKAAIYSSVVGYAAAKVIRASF